VTIYIAPEAVPLRPVRFALVQTVDFELSRWEIHSAECDDVTKSIRRGLFTAIVSAESPGALVQSEIAARATAGMEEVGLEIMPCCADTAPQMVRRILVVSAP
jgi:hypothetical protein